ncbi:MAG: hypothetical protein Fur0022_19270 [Anaerolineales bacterium]
MTGWVSYYTDEHVSKAIINGLRQRGVDVLTTKEAGLLGATDEQHLAFASSQKRVIFTQDDDFLRLHANGFKHAGIVYAPQHSPVGEVIRGLMLIFKVLAQEDMENHIEYLLFR